MMPRTGCVCIVKPRSKPPSAVPLKTPGQVLSAGSCSFSLKQVSFWVFCVTSLGMTEKYILYFDDTGSRDPDKSSYKEDRDDDMDCFGLGGFLIKEEDVAEVFTQYHAFCQRFNITYPLHSQSIRGGRDNFGWLRTPERAGEFMPALDEFLLSLPVIGMACVIDRPGYLSRYKDRHDKLWFMCKTAFTVLVERSAKFADDQGRKLEIYFEETGKKEDRDITAYMRELKTTGSPFDQSRSGKYAPLLPADYARIILGEPRRKTKKLALLQIADLLLYAIAKGGYDPTYRPYHNLKEAGKLMDGLFSEEDCRARGIKYSCFPDQKE